jgi:hypothetical protein
MIRPIPAGSEPQPFVEIFPVRAEALPPLTAYVPVGLGDDPKTRRVGGRLAYRLRAHFGGVWVWVGGRLVTDTPIAPEDAEPVLAAQRAADRRAEAIAALAFDPAWQPSAAELADLVVRGWALEHEAAIAGALGRMTFQLKHLQVEREAVIRAWVIDEGPALSVSIHTRLLYTPTFAEFAATLAKPADLVGLHVTDRTSTLHGTIVRVVGRLADHRARLLSLSQRTGTRQQLESAPDDEWVVRVLSRDTEYDYIGAMLQLVVTMDTANRFDVISAQVDKALHLKPGIRAQLVKSASDVLKGAGLIDAAYNAQNAPHLFDRRPGDTEIMLGGKHAATYAADSTPVNVARYGLHTAHPSLRESSTLRIALLNALPDGGEDFLEALGRTVQRDFACTLEIAKTRRLRVATQTNLETGVRDLVKGTLQTGAASLMLVLLPDSPDTPDTEEGIDAYFTRLQTIGRGQACLVVHESTMNRPDAMPALVTGMLARAGSLPYIFDAPLPFCDRVVGLSITTQHKRDHRVVTGQARIFRSDGLLLRAITTQIELSADGDDAPPEQWWAGLLPRAFMSKRRVLFHFDGRLSRTNRTALDMWCAACEAQVLPVTVLEHGAPRMYMLYARQIESPVYGTLFRVGAHEALMVTSAAPYDGTPQPLHLHVEAPLTLEQAADSIVAFAALHYGALKRPKLPITLHHLDTVGHGIGRGVHPAQSEASAVYWL